MPSTLLVLTDFSPAADHALTYADALADHLELELVLLYARHHSWLDPEALSGQRPQLSEAEIEAGLHERLNRLSVAGTAETIEASVPAATKEAVARHQPLLVVLGKPDTEHTPDPLVSTTSLELLEVCPAPLLVVPVRSAVPMPPARILVAADNNPVTLAPAAANLPHLLRQLGATVLLTHVAAAPEPTDEENLLAFDAMQTSGLLMEIAEVQTHPVRYPDTAAGIQQAVLETQADLVVVMVRPHGLLDQLFHQSVTAQVLRHSVVPVLGVPVGQ